LPEFRGFGLDEGRKLLPPPAMPVRKIEFIGDSMTCGYGVETTDEKEDFSDETENHYYTYAALTARALKAQHVVVARSGIGIYRNYNGPKTGNADCMPRVYDQTLFGVESEKWDFSQYTPDVVCVNLGTNDVSTDPYDKTMLENAYRDFYYTLRAKYPEAKIVFLSGCALVGTRLEHIQYAMDGVVRQARLKGDTNVYRFDMSHQTGDLGYGAKWHPSLWQQEKMAGELTAYLRGLMKWF
jgi:lysophospholipase L1-like esterase